MTMLNKALIRALLLSLTVFFLMASPSSAFWVWTPETNKWVNPKFAVKDTPREQLEYALAFENIMNDCKKNSRSPATEYNKWLIF